MNKVNYIEMGNRIRALRKRAGLTQEELADALDITVKHISSVERGLSMLSVDRLIMVCDMFQTSLDTLVRGKDCEDVSIYVPVEIQTKLLSGDETEKKRIFRYLELYLEIQESGRKE